MASDFKKKYDDILRSYSERYNVDELDSPNDISNLRTLINNQLIIDELQDKIQTLTEEDVIANIMAIQKLKDALSDLIERNIQLERALGIDRKTRKNEDAASVADVVAALKANAREFVEQRLVKVRCQTCNIMVGRISAVHDHTEYYAEFKCTQCGKKITVKRKERDVFFDVKDADWRRQYPVEIVQAKRKGDVDDLSDEIEDDADNVVIGDIYPMDNDVDGYQDGED